MNKKTVLIFGITGQDGATLSEQLLNKGYVVHGMIRRSSSFNTGRIDHLLQNKNLHLHYGDITDPVCLSVLISKIQPEIIYNLAAQSHVKVSFEIPVYTGNVDAMGTLYILEAIKNHSPESKLYQASTSELYGGIPEEMPEIGYSESTPFHPRSPYGVAKLYSYWIVRNYREAYNTFASNGILFNHEGPKRGETFVTRKITKWIGANAENILACNNIGKPLELGNLNAKRDWGHAEDFCEAMQIIMAQPKPDDYVVATGEVHSVKEFIESCFKWIGTHIVWNGEKENEVGLHTLTNQVLIKVNPKYYRPSEVFVLKGNPSKIKSLGWTPKHNFESLIFDMMKNDHVEK